MAGADGYVTQGVDFNYFERIVISDTIFPSTPQALIRFRGSHKLLFICEAGTLEYSFNGTTVHGDMTSGAVSEKLEFGIRSNKRIWFRSAAGATIRVEAWQAEV